MIDWGMEAAEKYGLEITNARRGRGSWIFETNQGLMLLKEYKGSSKRLEFEEAVLDSMKGTVSLAVDQYIRNMEGELISTAGDGTRYLVKHWFADRECDLKDRQEILSVVRQIAVLHKSLREVEVKEEWNLKSMISPPLYQAMEKHNRELRKARSFIRGKRKKNEFELMVIAGYDQFYEQAREACLGLEEVYQQEKERIDRKSFVCHGELNQHHLLIGDHYVAVTEFNKMHLGLQIEDLYYFMRKIMEKHDWDLKLGMDMMEAYEHVLAIDPVERQCLYYLFLYPEKYWKQINFYYNANKAWIPVRQTEKIQTLEWQQKHRMEFIEMLQKEKRLS